MANARAKWFAARGGLMIVFGLAAGFLLKAEHEATEAIDDHFKPEPKAKLEVVQDPS